MKQVAHIVFGSHVKKGLMNTIRAVENGEIQQFHIPSRWTDSSVVLECSDPLHIGPIYEVDEPMGFFERLSWLEAFLNYDEEGLTEDVVLDLTEAISDFYKKLAWLSEGQRVVIWHTPHPKDQIALRMLTKLLSHCDLYEVNLEAILQCSCSESSDFSCYGKEDYAKELMDLKRIDSKRSRQLTNEWAEHRMSKSLYRKYLEFEVRAMEEDALYDQHKKLANCLLNIS